MGKIKDLFLQLVKFGGVGGLCFIIDYGIMYALTEFASVPVLISTAISFSVSVIVNYILSVKFVFHANPEHDGRRDFILFVVFSVIGLGLTELIMKCGVDLLNISYLIVKIAATAIVMVFNFVTRKLFLER